jgi:hypothetical protein
MKKWFYKEGLSLTDQIKYYMLLALSQKGFVVSVARVGQAFLFLLRVKLVSYWLNYVLAYVVPVGIFKLQIYYSDREAEISRLKISV